MTITGTTFDRMRVTPADDALIYSALSSRDNTVIRGYGDKFSAEATGLNVYVETGAAIINGRLVYSTGQETISIPANTNGYICLIVDLTQDNTSTGTPGSSDYLPVNNQVKLQYVETLLRQDLHNGGKIYTLPLYSCTSSGTSVALKSMIDYTDFKEAAVPASGGNLGTFFFKAFGNVVVVMIRSLNGRGGGGTGSIIGKIPGGLYPYGYFNVILPDSAASGKTATIQLSASGDIKWIYSADFNMSHDIMFAYWRA